MSKEAIVERILSDAGNKADAIVKDAEEKAAAVVAAASARAEKGRRDSEAEVRAKTASISDSIRQRYSCPKSAASSTRFMPKRSGG